MTRELAQVQRAWLEQALRDWPEDWQRRVLRHYDAGTAVRVVLTAARPPRGMAHPPSGGRVITLAWRGGRCVEVTMSARGGS